MFDFLYWVLGLNSRQDFQFVRYLHLPGIFFRELVQTQNLFFKLSEFWIMDYFFISDYQEYVSNMGMASEEKLSDLSDIRYE